MYLYLGYLLLHSYSLMSKLWQTSMPFSAVVFSIVVFFIWTFIPFIGYCLGKLLKANGHASKTILFVFGIIIGLVEKGLFYFDFITQEQNMIGTLIVFILFFAVAYVSINKVNPDSAEFLNNDKLV